MLFIKKRDGDLVSWGGNAILKKDFMWDKDENGKRFLDGIALTLVSTSIDLPTSEELAFYIVIDMTDDHVTDEAHKIQANTWIENLELHIHVNRNCTHAVIEYDSPPKGVL